MSPRPANVGMDEVITFEQERLIPLFGEGIFEGKGTTRHVYETMTAYLYRTMPGGGRAAAGPISGERK